MNTQALLNRQSNPLLAWMTNLLIWLVPLSLAWWWLGGADLLLRALRVLADGVFPLLFSQGVVEILREDDHSWTVRTGLAIVGSAPPENCPIFIERKMLVRMVAGFPLFWALVLSTYGQRLRRLILGTLLMSGVALVAIASYLWATIPVLVNHETSLLLGLTPPPFHVYGNVYPSWEARVSSFAHFLAILIVPFVSPILVWVALSPAGLRRLLISLRPRR